MNDDSININNPHRPIGEGLQPWSLDPAECGSLVFEGPTARIVAQKRGMPGAAWELQAEYANGERAEIPFCREGALQAWMKLSPEVRSLLAEAGWAIARHEAMYGCLGTAVSCCLHFQVLVDDPADRAVWLLELARMMERTSSWAKSLRYFSQVVGLEPMEDAVWRAGLHGMARAHEALGNPKQAAHFRGRAEAA